MRVGPALEARILADVGRAEGRRISQHRAEQPVLAGELADRGPLLVSHARGDEIGETPLPVGDTDRRIARVGQLTRRVRQLPEHRLERPLGRDCQHRVADGGKRAAVEALAHDPTIRRRRPAGIGRATERCLKQDQRRLDLLHNGGVVESRHAR